MDTPNSSNNFGESNSQTTVAQTYDIYCNKVNNIISDQQPIYQQTISNNQQQYDANYDNYQQYNNQQSTSFISPDQRPNVASPNHNQQYQQYQQYDIASPNSQLQYDTDYQQYSNAISNYSNNVTISPGRQPMSNNNVTTPSDQQPNVSSADSTNHNQQYQQHNVASPNHQQQYDANYQYIHNTSISDNTDSHNHHQQPSDNNNHDSNNTNHNNNHDSNNTNHNNNHDSNNTNHNNNQPSSSNNDSSSQFSSPQSGIFLNITINSPQTNFIVFPNMDIQQILAFLNNSSGFQR